MDRYNSQYSAAGSLKDLRVACWKARVATFAVVYLSIAGFVHAMPASPHPYTVTQPDGTPMTIYIRGDEYFHWEEDSKGYTLMRDPGGTLVYATLDAQSNLAPTAARAGIDDPKAAGLKPGILPPPEIRNQKRAQVQAMIENRGASVVAGNPPSTVKNVVIMMRFSNHLSRTLPSNANISTIFNNVGPHALAPTGSVRDLYLENSYGQLTLDSSPFGWINLPQSEQFYANGNSGLGTSIWAAITAALNAADPLIDFSQFDEDQDGFVDAIAFIHSGYGAEWGGSDVDGTDYTNRIWSHRWSIPQWTSAEGVSVTDYHISPGLWATSGSAPGRIGVICHETGHFFGLPDLYDTNGVGEGIGSYCMMANSWGFTGDQYNPPHFSAWCKEQLGWVTPTVLSAAGTYPARRVEEFPEIYRIDSGFPAGEYLLVENRQPYGFEDTIPQGGLTVWHIDQGKCCNTDEGFPGQSGWPGNNRHYRVALLQADGLYQMERGGFGRGDAGDVYHGGGTSVIDGATIPNTHRYRGGIVLATNHRIHNVSASAATMTFDFDSYVPASGACCNDLTGVCTDNEDSAVCMQSGGTRFEEGGSCGALIPPCMSSVPENDDCIDAMPILDGFTFFDNSLASTDGPGDCLNGDVRVGRQDIWYVYNATCSGVLLVTECTGGTSFDATLQIYEGTSCGPLGTQLDCGDDDCEGAAGPSEVSVIASQDQSYLLRVAGWREQAGFGWLDIQCIETPPPQPPQSEPGGINKNRAFSMIVPPPNTSLSDPTAVRIRMVNLQDPNPPNESCCPPPNFSNYESATCTDPGGCVRWVGPPGTYLEAQEVPAAGSFRAARLQCTPYYHDWSAEGVVHVVGAELLPSSTYEVERLAAGCMGLESTCPGVSTPLMVTTARSGDIAPAFNPPATTTQPDAIDVTQMVNKFKNVTGALSKVVAQVQPNLPELNGDVNALDIVGVVDAVKQFAYAFSGPCPCPSAVTCGATPCATPSVCVTTYGAGALCVKTCTGGANLGDPCVNNTHCPGGSCSNGFCRDRCGRCSP